MRYAGAALGCQAATRLIHQDAAHGVGCRAEEVSAAAEVHTRLVHEPRIGLVDERSRVEELPRPFAAQQVGGNRLHLAIHLRNEGVEGPAVALVPLVQQVGDVRHGCAGY